MDLCGEWEPPQRVQIKKGEKVYEQRENEKANCELVFLRHIFYNKYDRNGNEE